ncbi:MAG: nitrous oxide reductase family maturation protein NosD [Actinomycetota bacterium]
MSAAGRWPAALVCAALTAALVACSSEPHEAGPPVIHVPADAPTLAAAIERSSPGDVILLAPGTYRGGVIVPPDHLGITIRGEDRNSVVFDGHDRTSTGIAIAADAVTVENLTMHSFPGNALVWKSVDGYRARFVTVWNVGGYGMYAVDSRNGVIERSLVSGAADAAFYVGECHPCHALLRDDTAMLSGIGYSGTNAGGELVVRDSTFDRNGTGILPNSFDDERDPPQRDAAFLNNRVVGSGTVPTPASDPVDGLIGLGIGVAGGVDDVVRGNEVEGSDRYGIAVFATIQPGGGSWRPAGNSVRDNRVRGSGVADLALAAGAAGGNCFTENRATTSLPTGLERTHRCGVAAPTGGDRSVSRDLEISTPQAFERSGVHPSYRSMPPPGAQPQMPPRPEASAATMARRAGLADAYTPRRQSL